MLMHDHVFPASAAVYVHHCLQVETDKTTRHRQTYRQTQAGPCQGLGILTLTQGLEMQVIADV